MKKNNKKWYLNEERRIMKKIMYEVKLEKSVKIILGILAFGVLFNAFSTPIAIELFGIKDALAETISGYITVDCLNCN